MASTSITHIPASRIQEALKRADSAMAKLQKVRSKTEEKVGEVFKAVETVGAGFAVGYFRGKYGAVEVGPGIPLEAVVGAGCTLAAFIDLPGKYSEHIHNIGNGILGSWATLEAVKLAGGEVRSAKDNTKELPAVTTQGETVKEREANLLNGNTRMNAREAFAGNAAQRQESEINS